MATAHIIHGFLGAGKPRSLKSSSGRCPRCGFLMMSVCRGFSATILRQTLSGNTWLTSERCWSITWLRALELGIDVVVDNGFWTRKGRNSVRALIASRGANYTLYRLSCPEEVAWQRIEKRNRDLKGSLLISRNTFETLKQRFEPLEHDELFVEIASR